MAIKHSLFMDAVSEQVHKDGLKVAAIFQPHNVESAQRLNYEQLNQRVQQRAQWLIAQGYHQKNIALLYPAGLDFVVNFLACLAAGVTAVPLNLTRNAQQLQRTVDILDDANIAAILTISEVKQQLLSQLQSLPSLAERQWHWIDETDQSDQPVELPRVKPEQLAFIQYTSGSTGRPKGVLISHGNIVSNQYMIMQACGHQPGLIAGGWLPQFHDMGLIGHMLQPLFLGGTYVFMPPLNFIQRPRRWLELISHYKIHSSAAPNFGYQHCLKMIKEREDLSKIDLSCWKVALNGSEPVDANTMRAFSERFQSCQFDSKAFFPCYGMAECTLFISGGPAASGMQTVNLSKSDLAQGQVVPSVDGQDIVDCGIAAPAINIKIVNPDSCLACTEHEIGEIWLSGDALAQGYWNDRQKSIETFQAKIIGSQQHYLRTGDMGFLLNGHLYVTGRIKEMLIIRGRNLYPYDIERTCNSHHFASGNNGASVFTYQERELTKLVAIVEINKRALLHENHEQLKRDLREAIVEQHGIAIDQLHLVKPGIIPKTTSGKVKRIACRDLVHQL